MDKFTNYKKRCTDCPYLKIHNNVWYCEECFDQLCENIDDCPEGVTVEEIEEIEKKTKNLKINIGAKSTETKTRKPREPKQDTEKEGIIVEIAEFMEKIGQNVQITNKTKLIEFDFGENHYKIDLIRQRKPKS